MSNDDLSTATLERLMRRLDPDWGIGLDDLNELDRPRREPPPLFDDPEQEDEP
jgi:hypothetical protein